jgi:branched-chain amino acid aminotransferase
MSDASAQWVFVDGDLIPAGSATVSLFDHGFLYGDGVFDTMFARNGLIFRLDPHLERFRRSRLAVGLRVAFSEDQLRDAVLETVRANGLRDAYVKIVATRGVGPEPLLDPRGCRPSVFVFARPYLSQVPPDVLTRGLSAKLTGVRRVPASVFDPRVKSLNYLPFVLARMEATSAGCDDALLADDQDHVCEAAGSNLFVVVNGEVKTPDRSILEGVTRQAVLDLCDLDSIPCRGQLLSPYDLYTADEVFLTSTAGGLMPVTRIDGRVVGSGEPGPVYSRLRELFDRHVEEGWGGTPVA